MHGEFAFLDGTLLWSNDSMFALLAGKGRSKRGEDESLVRCLICLLEKDVRNAEKTKVLLLDLLLFCSFCFNHESGVW